MSLKTTYGFFAAALLPAVAHAEDEVRIALLSGTDAAEVRGEGLTLFDGLNGQRMFAFRGRAAAVLAAWDEGVQARGGGQVYGQAGRILVEADGAVEVGGGVYYGRLEVQTAESGGLLVLNRLPLEVYLLGIVGSEMPPTWPIEALKAQAVAARTYALQRLMMSRAADQSHDLASTVISQVYKGAERIQDSVIEAVRSTRGQVLAHDRMLVEALFHSTCGGHTVASESYFGGARPYLQRRRCTWCGDSTRHRWSVRMPRSQVGDRLRRARIAQGRVRGVRRELNWARVRIVDDRGLRLIEPRPFRKALGFTGLYSERFSAETQGDWVVFRGQGFGHGVGMCQWGARGMAQGGRRYDEILRFYYPGSRVMRIY